MDKSDHSEFKYLVANESDHRWGITATSVGFQRVDPDEAYPSPIHPRGYYFDVVSGRVLDEYQLIYVVDGEGTLRTESGSYRLTAGTMFLIFPGGWHTYRPSPETGWSAYWIGFRGRVIDDRVGGGFFSGKSPVFRIGLSPLAVDVYREALAVAGREDPCYQQVLCGAVSLLMGLALNRSRREKPSDGVVRDKIARAKLMMIDNLSEPLSAQQIARRLNVSYSWFRSAFKRLTGMAPAQYLIELKLYRASGAAFGKPDDGQGDRLCARFQFVPLFFQLFQKKDRPQPARIPRLDSPQCARNGRAEARMRQNS